MEIDLDEIDFSQIPGYIPITAAVPNWKRDMIEKKNREKLEEYVTEMRRRKAEEDKWKNVPEWKRKLMQEKEQQKREQEMAKEVEAQEQKRRQKETEAKKREEKTRQMEMERELEEEEAAMPAWKREIMMKRGTAPKNWGDEREEENQDLQ